MTINVNKINKKIDKVKNRPFRRLCKYFENFIDFQIIGIGSFSIIFHSIFIFLVLFILIFNNNIFHLSILLIILFLDGFSIIVLHGCPLSHLEKKYLKKSTCKIALDMFKKAGILYRCNHEYENQLETVTYCWIIIACKCLIIIFLKTFNLNLKNFNNIYL